MSIGTPFHDRTGPLNRKQQWREWSGYFAASAYAVPFSAEVGDTLAGDVMVVTGGTLSSFMWLDIGNYQKYVAKQAYTALFQRDSFSQMSMQQAVPSAGRFYIVFVNARNSAVSCWARLVLE